MDVNNPLKMVSIGIDPYPYIYTYMLGMSSSQLTNWYIFQRGRYIYHQTKQPWHGIFGFRAREASAKYTFKGTENHSIKGDTQWYVHALAKSVGPNRPNYSHASSVWSNARRLSTSKTFDSMGFRKTGARTAITAITATKRIIAYSKLIKLW